MAQKTKSPASSAEEITAALRERLEAWRDAALSEIAEADTGAEQKVSRYHEAERELATARSDLHALRKEHEELPLASHTARMRGEAEEEARLNERFRTVEAEINGHEARVEELEQEISGLVSDSRRVLPSSGCEVQQRGPVAAIAHARREEAENLAESLRELVDDTLLAPIRTEAESLHSFMEQHSQLLEAERRRHGGG